MTLGQQIRNTFTNKVIDNAPRVVKGVTVRELKEKLRGIIYQDQKRFCDQIDYCGMQMSWSHQENSYVIHDPVMPK